MRIKNLTDQRQDAFVGRGAYIFLVVQCADRVRQTAVLCVLTVAICLPNAGFELHGL